MYLNCHSFFSLLRGTYSVEELVSTAKKSGVSQLALTDVNNTSAGFDFINATKNAGIKGVVGIEFRDDSDQFLYIGLPLNNEGFKELNELLSTKLKEGVPLPENPPHSSNTVFILPFYSLKNRLGKLPENHFIGVSYYQKAKLFGKVSEDQKHKLVALHPVFFPPSKKWFELHQVLRAVDTNEVISKLSKNHVEPYQHCFRSPDELKKAFLGYEFLLQNTESLLTRCEMNYEPNQKKNKLTFTNSQKEDEKRLRALTKKGFEARYESPTEFAQQRVEKELSVILQLGFATYFLITWDIVQAAKKMGFHHVGRGSGANSIVAYCLEITDVDPIELDLYFERFINPHRTSPPDFDVDFSWDERDRVIQYIFDTYGKNHKVGLIATYNTFKGKSILRELGKVYGLPKAEIDLLVNYPERKEFQSSITQKIFQLGNMMEGFPKHLSIHAGGLIISEKPLTYFTALEQMPKGFPITHWDMYVAEDIGYYKYDILSQRGLGHIKEAVEIIKENQGVEVDIHQAEQFKQDKKVKAQLKTGHCIGCFYIESPAMRGLLTKLQCDNYLSLVAASSIIRPGVAQSGMMREYIHRFHHPNDFEYIHPVMEKLLQETYGVMVYQEDVIKVAHHFAGIDLADADVLRRAMSGKTRSKNEMQRITNTFFENCRERGYPEEISKEVWRQIESFSGYSFSKAHSASFAVESFQSLYLKTYFPKEFMVAVINNFGGFYRTEFYVHEARMCGAIIHPPSVNESHNLTSIKGDDLYLGFIHLKELEKKAVGTLLAERNQNGAFQGLPDFIHRTGIHLEQLIILIRIGAFKFTGKSKKELLWEAHFILGKTKKSVRKHELFKTEETRFELPSLSHSEVEDALDEIELLGFPLCSPFKLLKNPIKGKVRSQNMLHFLGKRIEMIGYLVTVKPTYTVKRELMNFGCLLDEDGYHFDTVHFPPSLKRYPFKGSGCYWLKGKVVEDFGFPSLEVDQMEKLPYVSKEDLG